MTDQRTLFRPWRARNPARRRSLSVRRRLITGMASATTRRDRSDDLPVPGTTTCRTIRLLGRGRTTSRRRPQHLRPVGARRAPCVRCPSRRPGPVRGRPARAALLAAEAELVPADAPAARRRRAAHDQAAPHPPRTPDRHRARRAAILGATTSMAVASQGAIPGDTLYPVKRAIENTQAGFSVGDDAKGESVLGNASNAPRRGRRADPAGGPDATLVTETLNDFATQATEAADLLIADYEHNGDRESIAQVHQNSPRRAWTRSLSQRRRPGGAHDALLGRCPVIFALDDQAREPLPRPAARASSRSCPRSWAVPPRPSPTFLDRDPGPLPGHRAVRRPDARRRAAARRQGSRRAERPQPARDADRLSEPDRRPERCHRPTSEGVLPAPTAVARRHPPAVEAAVVGRRTGIACRRPHICRPGYGLPTWATRS